MCYHFSDHWREQEIPFPLLDLSLLEGAGDLAICDKDRETVEDGTSGGGMDSESQKALTLLYWQVTSSWEPPFSPYRWGVYLFLILFLPPH